MNVGLPGTGIGGLFYVLTAFLMPLIELGRTLRGRSSLQRWQRVATQTGLAVGILAGLWLTARVLQWCLPTLIVTSLKDAHHHAVRSLGATPTLITFMTLGGVLVGAEALHLFLRWESPRRS